MISCIEIQNPHHIGTGTLWEVPCVYVIPEVLVLAGQSCSSRLPLHDPVKHRGTADDLSPASRSNLVYIVYTILPEFIFLYVYISIITVYTLYTTIRHRALVHKAMQDPNHQQYQFQTSKKHRHVVARRTRTRAQACDSPSALCANSAQCTNCLER